MELLRQHKREQSEIRLQLGNLWQDSGLVFTQWDGKPMHPYTPSHWFHDFLVEYNQKVESDASLTGDQKAQRVLPPISFHGLRHTARRFSSPGRRTREPFQRGWGMRRRPQR